MGFMIVVHFQALHTVAMQHVTYGRSCIEPCLRQLVTSLDNIEVRICNKNKTFDSYILVLCSCVPARGLSTKSQRLSGGAIH